MSEAMYTRGPWNRDQYGTVKANGETLRINGVSLPCGGKPNDFDEVEANTNLITAAPELLEALAKLVRDADAEPDGEYLDGANKGCVAVHRSGIEAARAAIAKAKGVQP